MKTWIQLYRDVEKHHDEFREKEGSGDSEYPIVFMDSLLRSALEACEVAERELSMRGVDTRDLKALVNLIWNVKIDS